MPKGDFNGYFDKVKSLALGETLKKLNELDFSDIDHLFSENDYALLKEITEKEIT